MLLPVRQQTLGGSDEHKRRRVLAQLTAACAELAPLLPTAADAPDLSMRWQQEAADEAEARRLQAEAHRKAAAATPMAQYYRCTASDGVALRRAAVASSRITDPPGPVRGQLVRPEERVRQQHITERQAFLLSNMCPSSLKHRLWSTQIQVVCDDGMLYLRLASYANISPAFRKFALGMHFI